ncbi:MAG: hypothetical protein M3R03_10485 [Pseudomonadota bacterium]|nr:hypothetical protein [Pseudomonadota bacterium]
MKGFAILAGATACLLLPLTAISAGPTALSQSYLNKKLDRVSFTVTGTFSDGVTRDFAVAGDWDGDGKMDDGILSVSCSNGKAVSAVVTPRDPSSGLATGKRQYRPIPIRKRVAASDTQIKGSWDLATLKGAKMSGGASTPTPLPIVLDPGQPDLCPA